jgi:MFS family permease
MGGVLTDYFSMDVAFFAMGGLNAVAFLAVAFFLPEVAHRGPAGGGSFAFLKALRSPETGGLFTFHTGVNVQRSINVSFMPLFGALVLGLSPSLVGSILTIVVIGAGLTQIYTGHLADRFNRRKTVMIAGMMPVVAMILIPSAGGFWVLLVFVAVATIGDAISLPSATAMVVDEGRKYGMGMAMAVFNMALGLGQSIGPILAGLMTDWLGIKFSFYFAAAIVLVCTIAFGWLTRPRANNQIRG